MPERDNPTRRSQLWLIPAEGEARRGGVAEIAVRARAFAVYRYSIPAPLADAVRPGALVSVPYGRSDGLREGWCVGISETETSHSLKPIESVIAHESLLSDSLIELGLWVSEYYACTPAQALDAIIPSAFRKERTRKVRCIRATGLEYEGRLSDKQNAVLIALAAGEMRRDDVLAAAGAGESTLRTLGRRGLVELFTREEPAPSASRPLVGANSGADIPDASAEDSFALTTGQQDALERIGAGATADAKFNVFLLFGVPGSGKTEVYVRAIRRAIAAGQQAIMLVPEIALTTQLVERLSRRFKRVAVLHSRLTTSARRRNLQAIASGDVDVVIGTRTAVFAPCPRLGLIVVDEEQESSFKSLQAPLFHARDVAIKRGQIQQIPVVLGSATPALETWRNASTQPHFTLLRLPERVPGASPPEVRILRESSERRAEGSRAITPELAVLLKETINKGRQAILLHNRRGFAAYLSCERCGLEVNCERCGSRMVYHKSDERMKCHRCGLRSDVPQHCLDDTCGGRLRRAGSGIQRLEQELKQILPTARLQRLDSDTMRRREDYADALRRFAEREADVLLGTQMVAKGLDFPDVDLVGVIDADAALRLPDFRAAESAFQLLVQVIGRAGRRDAGSLAIIQAADPGHPVIRAAREMDYAAFADAQLKVRAALFDPPFCRLVRFVCADQRASRARSVADKLAAEIRKLAGTFHAGIRVDDPGDCVISRLRDLHRCEVLLRIPRDANTPRFLRAMEQNRLFSQKVRRFRIDVDPLDMM